MAEILVDIYGINEFSEMDSAYWGLGSSVDGLIYFALCTHNPRYSATIYTFDPSTQMIVPICNLSNVFQIKENSIPQGKIHTPLFTAKNNNLYFATHFAYPFGKNQKIHYEGGHWLKLNPKSNKVEDLGLGLEGEGIITLGMNKHEMLLYGLTAPSFHFLVFDIEKKKTYDLGQINNEGGICRTLTIDDEGNAYGSYEPDRIFKFDRSKFAIEKLSITIPDQKNKVQEWVNPGLQGASYLSRQLWRTAVWDSYSKKVYGIHSGTSRLFSFDPKRKTTTDIGYIGANKNINNIDNIYPPLSLVIYKRCLFYISVDGRFDYQRSEGIKGTCSLASYNIDTGEIRDQGLILGKDGRRIFGVAGAFIDKNGIMYLLGATEVYKHEKYSPRNILENKPFNLSLIQLNTKLLNI
jgi:hypothetical protein